MPADELQEQASQTREIVYELQQPETHRFALYHDYTETKPGTSTYVNIVRTGSSVSGPKGVNLDTGAELTSQIIHGAAIRAADREAAEVTSSTEAVLFHFPPLPVGGTARLRFYETYTDPGSYRRVGDELVWDRTFGRAANAVVLPSGWVLTNSSAPAITSALADGRIRLDFINPQSGELRVIITARKRANGN